MAQCSLVITGKVLEALTTACPDTAEERRAHCERLAPEGVPLVATGPAAPMADQYQVPETLAKISERHCPAGWEMRLVVVDGKRWGHCPACHAVYRIESGVLIRMGAEPEGTPSALMAGDMAAIDFGELAFHVLDRPGRR